MGGAFYLFLSFSLSAPMYSGLSPNSKRQQSGAIAARVVFVYSPARDRYLHFPYFASARSFARSSSRVETLFPSPPAARYLCDTERPRGRQKEREREIPRDPRISLLPKITQLRNRSCVLREVRRHLRKYKRVPRTRCRKR